jgi:hypothetical protein
VLDDAQTHPRRRGQGFAHHVVFQDGLAVIGDRHRAGGLESGKIVDRLAL